MFGRAIDGWVWGRKWFKLRVYCVVDGIPYVVDDIPYVLAMLFGEVEGILGKVWWWMGHNKRGGERELMRKLDEQN